MANKVVSLTARKANPFRILIMKLSCVVCTVLFLYNVIDGYDLTCNMDILAGAVSIPYAVEVHNSFPGCFTELRIVDNILGRNLQADRIGTFLCTGCQAKSSQ